MHEVGTRWEVMHEVGTRCTVHEVGHEAGVQSYKYTDVMHPGCAGCQASMHEVLPVLYKYIDAKKSIYVYLAS